MDLPTNPSSQEIEDFLESIPEISKRYSDLDGEQDTQGRKRYLVEKAVRDRLATLRESEENWLLELSEHNHSDDGDVEFVAKILLDYALDRPWVLKPDFIKRFLSHQQISMHGIASFLDSSDSTIDLSPVKVFSSNPKYRLDLHGKDALDDKDQDHTTVELLAECDAALGLAGFVPLASNIEEVSDIGKYHDTCRREFSNCVTIDGVQGHSGGGSTACVSYSTAGEVDHILKQISRGIHGINTILTQLQSTERLCEGIVFLRHLSRHTPFSQHEEDSVKAIVLPFDLVKDLCLAFNRHKEALRELAMKENVRPERNTSTISWAAALVGASGVFGTGFLAITLPISAAAVGYSVLYEAAVANQERKLFANLSELCPVVHEVLKLVGIKTKDVDGPSTATEVLHDLVLSIQFISLAIRSFVQGTIAPLDFTFLDRPISRFDLMGASCSSERQMIYAGAQTLSCLGDMIGHQVLVFRTTPLRSEEPLDVLATPAQIFDLWGPAKLLTTSISTKDIPSVDEITGIHLRGGIIKPSEPYSRDRPRLWHWTPIEDELRPPTIENDLHPIDKDMVIRIGATSHFRPVGPATLNAECQQFNKEEPIRYLGENTSEIGGRDSTWNLQSFQAGLQGGQFVVPQMLWSWEKSRGRSLKWNLLHPNPGFKWRIAQLDKIWGVFFSPCTGVMTRVRLRDLIGYIGPRWLEEYIPRFSRRVPSASIDQFRDAFEGSEDLYEWIGQLEGILYRQRTADDPLGDPVEDGREELQEKILSMIQAVLQNLQYTGIEGDYLVLGYMSDGRPPQKLIVPCHGQEWLRILTDSSENATFACVRDICLETPNCKCKCTGKDWDLPKSFRLSTKMARYSKYQDRRRERQPPALNPGKRYWINSQELGLTAKVVGQAQMDSTYHLIIRKSLLPFDLVKHFDSRELIREENDLNTANCMVEAES